MLIGTEAAIGDRGATAITVAIVMVLLMGFAALAIDLALGFNERRQDQTAADLAVMAGAVNYAEPATATDDAVVSDALEYARLNIDPSIDPTGAQWIAAWRGCQDPDRLGFDVGTGTPVDFAPMPEPPSWGGVAGATLECISTATSYLRVRIPDQYVSTSFGRVIGFDSLVTSAAAVAKYVPGVQLGGILPFGLPGGTGDGEACLSTNPNGIPEPPCQGSTDGGFGTINSEFFGDFFGSPPFCGSAGATELAQNIAAGVDHFVTPWTEIDAAAEGVSLGSPWPGTPTVAGYQNVSFDECSVVGGNVVPQNAGQTFPANAAKVDTGFPSNPVESGLISDDTFLGGTLNSRLQQGANPKRDIVKRRQGGNNVVYELDNKGPWEYLVGNGLCDPDSYDSLDLTQKLQRFNQCLKTYSGNADIFDINLDESPRFVWAPEYWHLFGNGTHFQPVYQYRMVFLGGVWFNCAATEGSCAEPFYPDSTITTELCDPGGGSNCNTLQLDQLSGWVLPEEAVPDSVKAGFPGAETPFEATLFK